ncbi:MAG: tetratricopeptide repeat protein [Deltaproteobacteria bacterium]|nr:MAG: tetratricopeptide repeat protein [Deltaproteobacteria bacterium]
MSDSRNADQIYNNGMYEFLNDNLDKSIEILSEAAESDPSRKLTFVSRGSAYLKLDRLEEALADFNHAIDLDPNYARAFHLRGLGEEKQGNDNSALNDFTRAIEINPEYGAAYHSRATLHTKMGNEDLAVEDIAMVQHLTDKNIETFANENNIWRSQQLRLESIMEHELER